MMLRSACVYALLLVILASALGSAGAADSKSAYPSKPIRVIIPFSPGGSADNLARTLQAGLNSVLGQTLVLDNRPGASSIIGAELAARSAPDGTSRSIIETVHAALLTAMAAPEMKVRLLAQGVEIVGGGPREFDQTLRQEIAKWGKVVRAAGIKAE